jgi:isocitrate dehydrogenase
LQAVHDALVANEKTILTELNAAQGSAKDIGGYFNPSNDLANKEMRASATFNDILASI